MMMKHTRRGFLKALAAGVPALLAGADSARASFLKKPLPMANLDFISEDMDILRRSEWTQVLPRAWLLRPSVTFDKVTVHHTGKYAIFDVAKKSVIRDLDGIITEHMDRNYGDIGYHFVVDYSGRLWEARSLAYEGAHVAGQNDRNIGVVCVGNFDLQKPSEAQLTTIEQLVSVLREHYGIKQHCLYGHRDLGHSACPGDSLYANVLKLKA